MCYEIMVVPDTSLYSFAHRFVEPLRMLTRHRESTLAALEIRNIPTKETYTSSISANLDRRIDHLFDLIEEVTESIEELPSPCSYI